MQTSFARIYPDVRITFNFGASSELKAQLIEGARADVYAPADIPQMEGAKGKGVIAGDARIFANNKLALIVPANNPKNIATPQDVAKPGVKLILAANYVPIGSYARILFAKMAGDPAYGSDFYKKALANIASEEPTTRAVVNRIALGELADGVVYASDVTTAVSSQVKIIPILESLQIIAQYPVALVTGVANEPAAQAFIAYLISPEGQAILKKWGFLPLFPTSTTTPPLASHATDHLACIGPESSPLLAGEGCRRSGGVRSSPAPHASPLTSTTSSPLLAGEGCRPQSAG